MARSYARLLTSIWRDPDFTCLTGEAQRLYLVLISQPELNACGMLPLRPKLWATFASNTPRRQIEASLKELESMVLIDESTDEVWVRSFMRHETLTQPALFKSACRLFDTIHSARIREALVKTLPRGLQGGYPGGYLGGSLGDIKGAIEEALLDPLAYPPVDPVERDATRHDPGSLIPDPGTRIPERLDSTTQALAIVEPPRPSFDDFWSLYPRKVGKGSARTAWVKAIRRATPDEIVAALRIQLPSITAKDTEYQPHPSTWLNGERWGDSPEERNVLGKNQAVLLRAMGGEA